MEFTPKYDRWSELSILAMLISPSTTEETSNVIISSLDEECFYLPNTKEFFIFLRERHANQKSISFIDVLGAVPDPIKDLCHELMDPKYISVSPTYAIDSLSRHKMIRPFIKTITESMKMISENNDISACEEIIISTKKAIENNTSLVLHDCIVSYESLIDMYLAGEIQQNGVIETKLRDWPPFPCSSMITVAGRSGSGKTFMGIFLMDSLLMAQPGTKAIYFNIEMSKEAMFKRHANIVKRLDDDFAVELRNGVASEMMKRNVSLVTKPGISIDEIEMIIKSESIKNKVSVVVVDYVGLVQSKSGEQRYLQLDAIAERLSGIALKHELIVIALQQVSRKPAERAKDDRIPYPSDAAGSQGFERSSHWWLGIDQPQIDDIENEAIKGLFVVQNRKQRTDGGYFRVYLQFQEGRFYEIDQNDAKERFNTLSSPSLSPSSFNYKRNRQEFD